MPNAGHSPLGTWPTPILSYFLTTGPPSERDSSLTSQMVSEQEAPPTQGHRSGHALSFDALPYPSRLLHKSLVSPDPQ